ncbi:RxLR effector protein [Phytophthora megakarya]|uniref:RxLR effector protein n=1 Tax=Phytophthora megakarya TaxID=4795 RepID=A0A225V0Y2_9STRA|nr:RxLR effector protein [Phytophthora megakarya]
MNNATAIDTDLRQRKPSPPSLRTDLPFVASNAAEAFSKRRLRLYDAVNVADKRNNEERIGFSGLSKFVENQSVKVFLKMGTNPSELFTRLRLAKDGVKLDDNPVFIRWLQYVYQYREKSLKSFYDEEIVDLLRNSKSDDELVTLFHNLRQVPEMKNLADKLQRTLLWISPTSNQMMNEVWLKNKQTPEEVFKILNLRDGPLDVENKVFLDWLRYTEFYRAEKGINSFSELQTMHYLLETVPMIEAKYGAVFQTLKEIPELKKLAESMQTSLFQRSTHVLKTDPKKFGNLLASPREWQSILDLPKHDPNFQTLEAYTLKYAKDFGGDAVLEKVKRLFARNDLEAAVAAAMKAS